MFNYKIQYLKLQIIKIKRYRFFSVFILILKNLENICYFFYR